MKLSAALIVRNEAPILDACLERLKGFDEIVVVDTGSEDNTVEIARKHTDKVFTDFSWRDDFSAARNHAASKATGDWILSVDADHALLVSADIVRAEAEKADAAGAMTALAEAIYPSGNRHWFGVLFKRGHAEWIGPVHEYLAPGAKLRTGIQFDIRESPSKRKDPDRNLRILLNSDLSKPRNRFYIAKEYFERNSFESALTHLTAYSQIADWLPEICEAQLMLAKIYWQTNRGDEARKWCLEAVRNNPDFGEALQFMATLHFEPWKHKWERLAKAATNEDVIFVRT